MYLSLISLTLFSLLMLALGYGVGRGINRLDREGYKRPRMDLNPPPLARYLIPVRWEHYETLDQERFPRVRLIEPEGVERVDKVS